MDKKIIKKEQELLTNLNPEIPQNVSDIILSGIRFTRGVQMEIKELPGASIVSNLLQGIIKDGLFSSFAQEFERRKNAGALKEEYLSSKQARYTLAELLNLFDKDIQDDKVFEAIKNIFIRAAIEGKEDVTVQQYIKTIKDLPSGCLLVLHACYKLKDKTHDEEPVSNGSGHIETDAWRRKIAIETGLNNYEIVCNFEDILLEKRLLASAIGLEKVYVPAHHFRLSDLGFLIMNMASDIPEL